MRGEILQIRYEHHRAAVEIAERLLDITSEKMVVAIGGESGAGKTAIAHVVGRTLKENGIAAKIVNLDNFYKVPPVERRAWREMNGLDRVGPDEYDWEWIDATVDAFRKDEEAEIPCVDLTNDQVDLLKTTFKGIRFLILDGLYPLRADADLKIHLDVAYDETVKAQELRRKETLDDFRIAVLEREHNAVTSLRPEADIILTKTFEIEEQT